MKATVKIDNQVIRRIKEFNEKVSALCDEYGLETHLASDEETNKHYIVIDIEDFVKEEDIKLDVEK